jgi:hypothetical protein
MISLDMKRDNSQMRSIALLGMIYLPMSSVAVSPDMFRASFLG